MTTKKFLDSSIALTVFSSVAMEWGLDEIKFSDDTESNMRVEMQ